MTAKRVTLYCIGVVLMALGFILNSKSALGISPLLSLAYCVSYLTGFSFADCTMIWYVICFALGLLIRGTKVRWTDFLQLPYCFFFSRIMSAFSALLPSPESIVLRILFLILAIICIGIGAAVTIHMYIIINCGDFIVKEIAVRLGKSVGLIKNLFDATIVCITIIVLLIAKRNILDVVGIGTIVTTLGNGRVIAAVTRLFLPKMEEIYNGSYIGWLDGKEKAKT